MECFYFISRTLTRLDPPVIGEAILITVTGVFWSRSDTSTLTHTSIIIDFAGLKCVTVDHVCLNAKHALKNHLLSLIWRFVWRTDPIYWYWIFIWRTEEQFLGHIFKEYQRFKKQKQQNNKKNTTYMDKKQQNRCLGHEKGIYLDDLEKQNWKYLYVKFVKFVKAVENIHGSKINFCDQFQK